MTTLKLALDWTPNVNHLGFLVAKERKFYQEAGIDLELVDPREDNYTVTPGKKVELDQVDFAIAPFETVISLNNKTNVVPVQAVFAILQKDLSCIATLATSGIERPAQLDGKTYASYKARYEDRIVQRMVMNDGGTGALEWSYPEKLGIWNTLLTGEADATWIFDNWEGVEAERTNVKLRKFSLSDFGIPYGYSPIVLAKTAQISAKKEAYRAFAQATKKGFLYSQKHPEEAAEILGKYVTDYDREHIDLLRTVQVTSAHFGTEEHCGRMESQRVEEFLNWLVENELEGEQILKQSLYTNALLF